MFSEKIRQYVIINKHQHTLLSLYLSFRLIFALSSNYHCIMGSLPPGIILCLFIASVSSSNFTSHNPDTFAIGAEGILDIIFNYITPRAGPLKVSDQCLQSGDNYLNGILKNESYAMRMLDSSAMLPSSGFIGDSNILHHPGSFSECLDTKDAEGNPTSQYCLLTVYDTTLTPKTKDQTPDHLPMTRSEHFIPDKATLQAIASTTTHYWKNGHCQRLGPPDRPGQLVSGLTKIGKCLPIDCNKDDISNGGTNMFITHSDSIPNVDPDHPIAVIVHSCHQADEKIEFTNGDIVMITVVAVFGCLICFSTFLDIGITVLELKYLPESLLPMFQGFSAYHNTIKIFQVGAGPTDGSNLSCINGLKYISISWIVLGHTTWEYCFVSGLGVFSKSFMAVSEASDNIAFTAVWNGLIGVDTFFVIGGCLLSFHTLKELDKTKGGNAKMWAMFYVHRYIRLTGVYAIIIGLHATLLKFFATGPQSHLVTGLVNKCEKGWWTNLLYINNFAADIYGASKADCINVSWYMAIDMQFFILTPIVVTLLWKMPKAGYALVGLLIAGGTACQIYFTIADDEFFHGGFRYYMKPWNRSHPYLIGLLLGYLLHKMRDQPKLKINPYTNMFLWGLAGFLGSVAVYSIQEYNIIKDVTVALPCGDKEAPLYIRVLFNGFAKIAWGLAISWVILACVKQRGGLIDSFLSWSAWVPLARLQYCVYLLHRSIIIIVNSYSETVIRYSHTLLTFQFIGILSISTFAAFVFVIMFEAPIVQLEKIFFASLGMGRMPQKRKEK